MNCKSVLSKNIAKNLMKRLDIIIIEDFDPDNILIDEKSYENILVCNNPYKSLIDSKPLRIRFDKIYGFIRDYDGTRYLVLFGSEKYDSTYNRIRYLLNMKSSIKYVIHKKKEKIKVDSYDSLTVEKN